MPDIVMLLSCDNCFELTHVPHAEPDPLSLLW